MLSYSDCLRRMRSITKRTILQTTDCLPTLQVGLGSTDYHIGYVLQSIHFQRPPNTLFDGSCCDASCTTNTSCCAAAHCSPTLRLCFREFNHPKEDVESCPLLKITRTQASQVLFALGTDNKPIQRFYTVWLYLYAQSLSSVSLIQLMEQL